MTPVGHSSVRIGFRPLAEADLPQLHRWLNAPHVLEWWDRPAPSLETVRAQYGAHIRGETDVSPYVLLHEAQAIGYIQVYPVPDGTWGLRLTDQAVGVDLLIGEPEYVHKGLGPRLLSHFLRACVFATGEIAQCFVDPSCRNQVSIRAFSKVGFRQVGIARSSETGDAICVMRVTAADVAQV